MATDGTNVYTANYGTYDSASETYNGTGLTKITSSGVATAYGDNSFEPFKIVSDTSGNVFSIDFTPFGGITKTNGSGSSTFTSFSNPYAPIGLTTDSSGNLYVLSADISNYSSVVNLSKFNSSGVRTNLMTISLGAALYVSPYNTELRFDSGSNTLAYAISGQAGVVNLADLSDHKFNDEINNIVYSGTNQVSYLHYNSMTQFDEVKTFSIVPQAANAISLNQISFYQFPNSRNGFLAKYKLAVNKTTGEIYSFDPSTNEVWKMNLNTGVSTAVTVTGYYPSDLLVDSAGNVYFNENEDNSVRKINCAVTLTPDALTLSSFVNAYSGCEEVMQGPSVTCYLGLKMAPHFVYSYSDVVSVALANGSTNFASASCGFDSANSLVCSGLQTSQDTTAGLKNIVVTVNSSSEVKGTVYFGGQFNNWSKDPVGTTLSRPEITSFNNNLIESVRGSDNKIYTRSSSDGSNWSSWSVDPISFTLYPVTMATFNTTLYQSAVGTGNKIYTRSSNDGNNWSTWSENGGSTSEPLGMTSFNNKLFQAAKGNDSRIYTRSFDGNNWSDWTTDNGGSTNRAVAIAVQGNTLYEAVRGDDSSIYLRSSTDGLNWGNWNNLFGSTDYAVNLASYDKDGSGPNPERLYITAVGTGNKIYTSFLSNTYVSINNWNDQGGTTPDPVSTIQFNGKLYQAVRGSNSGIYLRNIS